MASAPLFTASSRAVILLSMMLGTSFSFISGVIFIFLFWRYVISRNRHTVEVHSVLIFYKVFEILNAVLVCIHLSHASTLYRVEDDNIYVTSLFFWDGALHNVTSILRPIAIFVLGFDRICIIIFTLRVNWQKKHISLIIGIILMTISTILLFVYRIFPNIPKENEFYCPNFGCLTKYGNPSIFITLRMIFGSANLVVGILLLILIGNLANVKGKHGKNNPKTNIRLVFFILLLTFLLDFLPHIIGFIFQAIVGASLATYLGPYSTVIAAIESMFCGLIYFKTLSRKKQAILPSTVTVIKS